MPLDSTVSSSNAKGANKIACHATEHDPEIEMRPEGNTPQPWHYLFIHRNKVDMVSNKLKDDFAIYIHRNIIYRVENKRIRKDKRATVSGLLFVQGDAESIKKKLKDNFYGLHLVNDCMTGKTASIADSVMQRFMLVSETSPTLIRFMPHPIDYYSTGNVTVRLTSGPLAGMEGYRIRIDRDRCLITSMGGMTVAIGGIHKDSFENVDLYLSQRREQQQQGRCSEAETDRSPLQASIANSFITPQDKLDLMALEKNIAQWTAKAANSLEAHMFEEALEMAQAIVYEMAARHDAIAATFGDSDLKGMIAEEEAAMAIITAIANHPACPAATRDTAEGEQEQLTIRFPWVVRK